MSILAVFLIVTLLGLNAYQWMTNSKLKSNLSDKRSDYLELEKANTELNFNYEAKLEELESLRGDNQELNSRIDAQKEDLAKQKRRISSLIWTEKELGKARTAMAELNTQANSYIAEINKLKAANASLTSANTQLQGQNEVLNQEVEVNQARISSLDSARTILVSQTEELNSENETLATKVDMAEAIKINVLEVKGLDERDNGEYKVKNKAKKLDVLRTCFTTETNLVTESGDQDFYVSYTAPSGQVLWVESLGGGSIRNKLTGEEVKYTTSGTIEYENDDLKACLDWRPNFQLAQGTYKVNVYNNGFPVGEGSFTLK